MISRNLGNYEQLSASKIERAWQKGEKVAQKVLRWLCNNVLLESRASENRVIKRPNDCSLAPNEREKEKQLVTELFMRKRPTKWARMKQAEMPKHSFEIFQSRCRHQLRQTNSPHSDNQQKQTLPTASRLINYVHVTGWQWREKKLYCRTQKSAKPRQTWSLSILRTKKRWPSTEYRDPYRTVL